MSVKAHHCQLPATPWVRTMFATRFGVSLEKVVATSDMPASHQGTDRPPAKNSDVLLPERLPNASAGRKQINRQAAAMNQSMVWRTMMLQRSIAAGTSFQFFAGPGLEVLIKLVSGDGEGGPLAS